MDDEKRKVCIDEVCYPGCYLRYASCSDDINIDGCPVSCIGSFDEWCTDDYIDKKVECTFCCWAQYDYYRKLSGEYGGTRTPPAFWCLIAGLSLFGMLLSCWISDRVAPSRNKCVPTTLLVYSMGMWVYLSIVASRNYGEDFDPWGLSCDHSLPRANSCSGMEATYGFGDWTTLDSSGRVAWFVVSALVFLFNGVWMFAKSASSKMPARSTVYSLGSATGPVWEIGNLMGNLARAAQTKWTNKAAYILFAGSFLNSQRDVLAPLAVVVRADKVTQNRLDNDDEDPALPLHAIMDILCAIVSILGYAFIVPKSQGRLLFFVGFGTAAFLATVSVLVFNKMDKSNKARKDLARAALCAEVGSMAAALIMVANMRETWPYLLSSGSEAFLTVLALLWETTTCVGARQIQLARDVDLTCDDEAVGHDACELQEVHHD